MGGMEWKLWGVRIRVGEFMLMEVWERVLIKGRMDVEGRMCVGNVGMRMCLDDKG